MVRNVTSAGLADYLPRAAATAGATIQCLVTARDGRGGESAQATAQAIVKGAAKAREWMLYQ